jgi:hypothetical protein
LAKQVSERWSAPYSELFKAEDRASLEVLISDTLHARRIKVPRARHEAAGTGPARISWDAADLRDSPDLADCLWSFAKLAGKPDEDIVRFAARWGPLGICGHGRPVTHDPACEPLSHLDRRWEDPVESAQWAFYGKDFDANRSRTWRRFWEPLSAWRFYSGYFATILAVALRLQEGQPVEPSLWFDAAPWRLDMVEYEALVRGDPYPPYATHTQVTVESVGHLLVKKGRAAQHHQWIAHLANLLIRDAGLVPAVVWNSKDELARLGLSFGKAPRTYAEFNNGMFAVKWDSLFAVLTAELVAALQHPNGLFECSMCGGLLTRNKKPRKGQRRLCSSECGKKAQREDKRTWASKDRAKQRRANTPICTPKPANNGGTPRTTDS